ncbi:MAG: hypothetical protein H7336_14250 [Bacteriovorax sp.]|nr:hypothetical protein [Bacteriovorax sp.]
MKALFTLIFLSSSILWAGNPDTIRACSNIRYTKNHDLNVCIKSGADSDAVIACGNIGIQDMAQVNECITSGASKEKINACSQKSSDINSFRNCIRS